MLPLVASGLADVRAALDALGLRALPAREAAELAGSIEPTAPTDPAEPHEAGPPRATLPPLPPGGGARPEQRLAACLGLSGCVNLADHLERADHAALPPAGELAISVHALASAKLARSRAALHERLKGRTRRAFELRGAPHDATAMLALLHSSGALSCREPAQVVACARQLQRPYRDHFADSLSLVRKELRFAREDMHVAVRRLGARGAQLLELDALMQPSMAARALDSHAALAAAVERRFAERFMAALVELPTPQPADVPDALDVPDAPAVDLSPWFGARGWIWGFLFDCQRVCLAVLDAECAAIQGLLDATCGPQPPQARATSMPPPAATVPPSAPNGPVAQPESETQ